MSDLELWKIFEFEYECFHNHKTVVLPLGYPTAEFHQPFCALCHSLIHEINFTEKKLYEEFEKCNICNSCQMKIFRNI